MAQIFVAFSEKLNLTKTFDILANIVNEYQIVSFLHVLEGWVNLKVNKPSRNINKISYHLDVSFFLGTLVKTTPFWVLTRFSFLLHFTFLIFTIRDFSRQEETLMYFDKILSGLLSTGCSNINWMQQCFFLIFNSLLFSTAKPQWKRVLKNFRS